MKLFRYLTVALALGLTIAMPAIVLADNAASTQQVKLGPLVLTGGFSRATLPNAPVAGGFLTIQNTSTEDDTLIAASSPVAGHAEVHEMAMEGDTMKMRELPDGLPIPAGATVTLQPGGFHIMLMDLKEPLVEGTTITVTLIFSKAGSIDVPLMVGAKNAKSPAGMDHSQMDMGAKQGTGHIAASHGAADHAATFDQTAIDGDQPRIEGLLRATFETPEKPLSLDPVLIAGDRAVVGWVQGEMGGRALLDRNDQGIWRIALCAGDGLKGQANMEAMGLSPEQAAALAAAQADAETSLSPETVAKLDSFGAPVHFD